MYRRIFAFILSLWIVFSVFGADPLTKKLYMSLNYPYVQPISGDKTNSEYIIKQKQIGHKNLSFDVIVPVELLSPNWSVIITPQLLTNKQDITLPEVVIAGNSFKRQQDADYNAYIDYVKNTIDSTLYKEEYINYEQLKYDIEHMHDTYWQYFYDEWDMQIKYEYWKSKNLSGTHKSFYPKVKRSYEEQIRKQYELRIKIQTQRYLKAKIDTTGISKKYMNEYKAHARKLPRYSLTVDSIKNVPKQFKHMYDTSRTLDDITDAMWDLLNEHDSVLMNLPAFDYEKIKMNEKRKFLVDKVYKSMVKFPYYESALLDTTLSNYDKSFIYQYNCPNELTDYLSDTITVKLLCRVIALDETVYNTSSQNTINYIFEGKNLPPKVIIEKEVNNDSITNWFE